jgi:CRISPR-associated protein Cas2
MRRTYVVAYDVSDPKRLRQVFRILRGYGDHLQLSVFSCDLSPAELVELQAKLRAAIAVQEDQVLFVDVGPQESRAARTFSTLGRPSVRADAVAIIV